MSSATISRRSSSIIMENDVVGSGVGGSCSGTTSHTFYRRNSIQPRCSISTTAAPTNDGDCSETIKNRKQPHRRQLMRHESIDGNHSDISVNSSIKGNRRRSSYYRNPCRSANQQQQQQHPRQQSPQHQHRFHSKHTNDIATESISSKSTKSTASNSGSCNGISCSDDCDSSTTSGEPNLPYPGFPEIALKYLTQDSRPRSWCLLLITNPYPFSN